MNGDKGRNLPVADNNLDNDANDTEGHTMKVHFDPAGDEVEGHLNIKRDTSDGRTDTEGHHFRGGNTPAGEGDLEARNFISVDGDPTAEDTEGHAFRHRVTPAGNDTDGHGQRSS